MEEEKKHQEIAFAIMQDVAKTGFFKPERLPELNAKIMKIRYGYSDLFSYKDCLSLEEKKSLGLNPRQKFSREFFDFLTKEGLSHPDPKNILKVIYFKHFHNISRKYELNRLKKNGVKKVKIMDCGDERDCKIVKKVAGKVWPINKVPALPLQGCNAEYCRCGYIIDE